MKGKYFLQTDNINSDKNSIPQVAEILADRLYVS